MRLGAPIFLDSRDPEAFARAHRAEGYRAAYCPGWLTIADLPPLTPALLAGR